MGRRRDRSNWPINNKEIETHKFKVSTQDVSHF